MMKTRITDSLHLLQAKEVAKKVPDNMHTIRRIIQYSKLSKDSGDELDFHSDIPAYVFVAVCCVVVLYLSLILSGVVLWWGKFGFGGVIGRPIFVNPYNPPAISYHKFYV